MNQKIKSAWTAIKKQLKSPLTWCLFIGYYILLYSPAIVGYLLFWTGGNKINLTYATAWATFWSVPITPGWAIVLGATVGTKAIIEKIKGRRNKNVKENKN